jgi:phosphate transport system permease protein
MATEIRDPKLMTTTEMMKDEALFRQGLRARHRRGALWKRFFQIALGVAFLALIALFFNIINAAFGYIVEDYAVNPTTLAPDGDLNALTEEELVSILLTSQSNRLPVYIRDYLFAGDSSQFTSLPMYQALPNATLPEGTADLTVRELTPEQQGQILIDNMDQRQMVSVIRAQVVSPSVLKTYSLMESIFNRAGIEQEFQEQFAAQGAVLRFYSWVNIDFITSPMSSNPAAAGVRTAILGTLWVVVLTILIAFPIGVGAAIYLEEYSSHDEGSITARISRIIETNIRNLAGVPSIIYGLLGLAIFVRALSDITGGRTIISASLTMALLILPVIIINSQEAIRAVPSSLRDGSFGLGATRWQTVYKIVMPSALPGILTGTILGMSRAIGETAPLIIIGASTFILTDPTGPLSKFTVLPIQIYNWTSRPQQPFRDAAAAGIVVLLIMLLLLNATAIIVRQRARRRLTS